MVQTTTEGMSGWTTGEMCRYIDEICCTDVVDRASMGLRYLLREDAYDVVCIMAGTNDIGTGCGSEEILANLQTLIAACFGDKDNDSLNINGSGSGNCNGSSNNESEGKGEENKLLKKEKNKQIRVMLCTVPMCSAELYSTRIRRTRAEVNTGIEAIALGHPHIHLVDASSILPQAKHEYWDNDGLHLSPEGSAALGRYVHVCLVGVGLLSNPSNESK